MSVNSRLKSTKITGQRKAFYRQKIPESSCARKETVDIHILVTSRNGDRKIMLAIRIISRPLLKIRKWSQFSQFRWTPTKVILIEETKAGYMPTMSQGFKRGRDTSPDMKTVFHSWLYGRYIEIQSNLKTSKKLHRTNQGSNFLGGSFSNTDNIRVPIQFRRESQLQHLERWFLLKNKSTLCYISSTSLVRPVSRN